MGERSEYETLIRPVEDRMLKAIWRITQDDDDAEDAVQEAVKRVWSVIGRVRRHPNPGALVLRIGVAAACDIVRRSARRRRREVAVARHHAGAAESFDPVAVAVARELREEIARALAGLPERQAVAITMRFLLDSSYEEIAAALGCAVPTARVHAARGLERLRRVPALSLLHPSQEENR